MARVAEGMGKAEEPVLTGLCAEAPGSLDDAPEVAWQLEVLELTFSEAVIEGSGAARLLGEVLGQVARYASRLAGAERVDPDLLAEDEASCYSIDFDLLVDRSDRLQDRL